VNIIILLWQQVKQFCVSRVRGAPRDERQGEMDQSFKHTHNIIKGAVNRVYLYIPTHIGDESVFNWFRVCTYRVFIFILCMYIMYKLCKYLKTYYPYIYYIYNMMVAPIYVYERTRVCHIYLNIYYICYQLYEYTYIRTRTAIYRYYNIYKSVKADWEKITRSSSRCIILNIMQQQSYSVDILCVHCTLVRLIMDYKVLGSK